MTDTVTKRRGRPSKTNPNDPVAIAKKIVQQKNQFGAKCADKLDDLMGVMFDVATDSTKSTTKDKMLAAKWCIEYATKFLEDVEVTEETKSVPEEDEGVGGSSSIISLVSNK